MRGKKNERESDKDSWKKTKSERSVQKVKTKERDGNTCACGKIELQGFRATAAAALPF